MAWFRSRYWLWLPPPLIMAISALVMWLGSQALPLIQYYFVGQVMLAVVVASIGLLCMLLAAHAMRQAHTTLLPFDPSQASTLVTQGVFRYSRNPIYLGDALLLLAWAIWLGTGFA